MLFLILTIILLILCILGVVFGHKYYKDDLGFLSILIGICAVIALICEVAALGQVSRETENFRAKYYNAADQIQCFYEVSEIDDMAEETIAFSNLSSDILEINNTIDRNKIYSKSPWIGIWFSEEIGRMIKLSL